MIDPNMEIRRLRTNLLMRRLPENVIDEVTELATKEISQAISEVISGGLEQAIAEGERVNATDFVAQLRAINVGSYFQVTTDSGQMDFSEPPWPMLPSLLKNAKTAKDGSRYKVIPIKEKTPSKPKRTSPNRTSIEAMRTLDQARREGAQGRQARQHGERRGTMSIFEDAKALTGYYNNNKPAERKEVDTRRDEGTTTKFRTASSKQDPAQDWVNPGRKIDMSETIRRINMDMQSEISTRVMQVIDKYDQMYRF